MTDTLQPLLTTKEVCAILRMTDEQLRKHVVAGELFCVVTGRGKKRPRRMYQRGDVEAFIAKRRRTGWLALGGEDSVKNPSAQTGRGRNIGPSPSVVRDFCDRLVSQLSDPPKPRVPKTRVQSAVERKPKP